MSLRCHVDGLDEVRADVDDAGWATVAHTDPDACVTALTTPGGHGVEVTLDGQPVRDLRSRRDGARLGVVTGRIGALPTMRVADVVLLGLHAPQPPLWRALLGTRTARTMSADDEAQARALAGRVGLARWMDDTAVDLAPEVEALVDLTRALAGRPHGLVWRRPEWLAPDHVEQLRDTVAAEQRIGGFAVAEFTTAPVDTLPPP